MPIEYQTSEDASQGGAFVTHPGTYHFMVIDSQEQATDKDGKPLDGFRVVGQVLAGTVPGEKGKTLSLIFFHPKPTDKNEGAMARKKQTRCFIALSKMKPADAGKKIAIDLTPDETIGRQLVVTLEKEDGKDYLRLHFADIFHVDDPEAAPFPKDANLLASLPPEWRMKPEDFGGAGAAVPGGGSPSPNGSGNGSHKPATKPAPASAVDLDDI